MKAQFTTLSDSAAEQDFVKEKELKNDSTTKTFWSFLLRSFYNIGQVICNRALLDDENNGRKMPLNQSVRQDGWTEPSFISRYVYLIDESPPPEHKHVPNNPINNTPKFTFLQPITSQIMNQLSMSPPLYEHNATRARFDEKSKRWVSLGKQEPNHKIEFSTKADSTALVRKSGLLQSCLSLLLVLLAR